MITGTGEAMMASMMSRVASESPPGVWIWIRMASALISVAYWIPRWMYSVVMGWMVSWIVTLTTSAREKLIKNEELRMKNKNSRTHFFIAHTLLGPLRVRR